MIAVSASESALRKQHLFLIAGLTVIAGVSWTYTARLAWQMDHMGAAPRMFMPHAGRWTLLEFWLLFAMWAVMMVAMMLPSAAPLILLFAAANRNRKANGRPSYAGTWLFICGYLLVWLAFSVIATAVQWALHQGALLSPMMVSRTPILGSAILVATGVFQWTPWKNSCLRRCRSPLEFIMSRWHSGNLGALRMGVAHGTYCTGCCWCLMALLFVTGVMNLLWIAAIAAFVLIEKVLPGGATIGKAAGTMLVAAGLYMLRGLF